MPLWAVAIEMQFLSGQEALENVLERVAQEFDEKRIASRGLESVLALDTRRSDSFTVGTLTTIAFSKCSSSRMPIAACWASCLV